MTNETKKQVEADTAPQLKDPNQLAKWVVNQVTKDKDAKKD